MSRAALAVALAMATLAGTVGQAPAAAAPATTPAPSPPAERPPAVPGAAAALVVDARDGTVLFARRPDQRRAIASTTKLMTALLALERARPNQTFPAAAYDALPVESQINLATGERMRVADLLEALLLESANDAAVTLAEGVSGSRAAFVAAMNRRAAELGLSGTSYANPIGLDDPANFSTARDLARLAARLLRNARFARIVDTPRARLESGGRPRVVANRNRLVASHRFVDGVKTGHTLSAGYVLVGAATDRGGARVVSVVLGEPSEAARDAETLALLRYGLRRFHRVGVLRTGQRVARVPVAHRDESVELAAARPVALTVRRGQAVRRRLDVPAELDGPLPAGRRVGSVSVLVDGRRAERVPLVTATEVAGAGTLRVLVDELGPLLTLLVLLGILGCVAFAVQRRVRRPRVAREAGRRPRIRSR